MRFPRQDSRTPSIVPSIVPSMAPSMALSMAPSMAPNMAPSMAPSMVPSIPEDINITVEANSKWRALSKATSKEELGQILSINSPRENLLIRLKSGKAG